MANCGQIHLSARALEFFLPPQLSAAHVRMQATEGQSNLHDEVGAHSLDGRDHDALKHTHKQLSLRPLQLDI